MSLTRSNLRTNLARERVGSPVNAYRQDDNGLYHGAGKRLVKVRDLSALREAFRSALDCSSGGQVCTKLTQLG
jgi:hypothetical protein